MALIIYNLSVWFYHVALRLAAPFNPKADKMLGGRKNLLHSIKNQLQNNTSPVVWFHCASLGEFEQGRPVIEAFRQQYPAYKIVLTFFSPSGYEIRKNYEGADYIFYLPFDTSENAAAFLDAVKPTLAVFVKYEFWHHYIFQLAGRNIPVISISAIFRDNQLFFKPYGQFYRNILKRFSHIFTQNQHSADLLKNIGINQVTIAGDTRFDRVLQTAASVKMLPMIEAFANNKPVFVIGSSWPEDMKVLLPFIKKNIAAYKFIIAPHEISEQAILQIINAFDDPPLRYSKAETWGISGHQVLIIDNIGMLSSIYKYATFAFIGGAFGKGLHNVLEAAVFGSPLFFGPSFDKFQEAKDLVKLGCAFPVNNSAELENAFKNVVENTTTLASINQKSKAYINEKAGATNIIMQQIGTWLNPKNT